MAKNLELIAVGEDEFNKAMLDAARNIRDQCSEFQGKLASIQTLLADLESYKSLGYKITYSYNKKTNEYNYKINEKRRLGFK